MAILARLNPDGILYVFQNPLPQPNILDDREYGTAVRKDEYGNIVGCERQPVSVQADAALLATDVHRLTGWPVEDVQPAIEAALAAAQAS